MYIQGEIDECVLNENEESTMKFQSPPKSAIGSAFKKALNTSLSSIARVSSPHLRNLTDEAEDNLRLLSERSRYTINFEEAYKKFQQK